MFRNESIENRYTFVENVSMLFFLQKINMLNISPYKLYRGNMSSQICSNYERDASELLANREVIFPHCM